MSTPEEYLDTRETPELEEHGRRLILKASNLCEQLEVKIENLPKPDDTSPVALADKLAPFEPVSDQIRLLLGVSIENLRSALLFMSDGELPLFAQYSVIRSAVEASSKGIYLLTSGSKNAMAFNAIRFSYNNHELLESLGKTLGQGLPEGISQEEHEKTDPVRARLKGLRDALRGYEHKELSESVSNTTLVEKADKLVKGRHYFNGLQTWKACSGIAHGNSAVIPHLLERQTLEVSADGTRAEVMLTSRMTFIGGFLIAAGENIETLLRIYKRKCMSEGQYIALKKERGKERRRRS